MNSTKERRIKFPYVACEIFCCEVRIKHTFNVYILNRGSLRRLKRQHRAYDVQQTASAHGVVATHEQFRHCVLRRGKPSIAI